VRREKGRPLRVCPRVTSCQLATRPEITQIIPGLSQAADAPKRSGSPKKSGKVSSEVIAATSGRGVIRLDGRKRNEVALTLLLAGGTSREEVVEAFDAVLARCFPNQPSSPPDRA
jgi:ParB family chromosome partitioning protein